ncbi:MAG: aminodeoxychorismate synthase component I [Bacteroidota bacterium]
MPKHGQIIDRAFLFSLLQQEHTILLDSSLRDNTNKKNFLFHSPDEILTANTFEEIPSLFRAVEERLIQKKWIAGYFSYECGYHFDRILDVFDKTTALPLIWLGVYEAPIELESELLNSIEPSMKSAILHPEFSLDKPDYIQKIKQLKKYIVNGDTYQVNFTGSFEFDITGDTRDFFFELRQKQHVPFGAYLNLGPAQILSFSPELFFRRIGNTITAKPMKGTCKRGRTTEEDTRLSEWLRNDEKNRSENLMIVDLLRNDIGRICENGSVNVSEMYSIERYESVLQMTSTIHGMLKKESGYYDIFRSLHPCGSVTGAPKIRTMQIINELEKNSRGIYCGAIGFISPNDEAVFNVAIRTVEVHGSSGIMGVGSGIVYDSKPESEFNECALKASFLLQDRPDFQLIETLLWEKTFTFFDQHVRRLEDSADYFSFPFNREKIIDALLLSARVFHSDKRYRVRLLLSKSGVPTVEAREYTEIHRTVITVAPERTNSADIFLFHKTTRREIYNRYWKKADDDKIADYIFLNENGDVTEGTVTNLFVEKNGHLFTPPIHCGVLSGIFRNEVLRTNPHASEKVIKLEDLRNSDALYLCNSIRGWFKVTLSE